jgi:hypothetical protein
MTTRKLFAHSFVSLGLLLALLVPAGLAQNTPTNTPSKEKQKESKPEATQQPAAEVATPEEESEKGMIEVGGRVYGGDVYGRPDLPFQPALKHSKLNEYSDIRNNFLIRRARVNLYNFLGTDNYLNYQTQKAFLADQSHLLSVGAFNHYKVSLRYDEIRHEFGPTARTPYVWQNGAWQMPLIERQALQAAASTSCGVANCTAAVLNNTVPAFVQTQLVPFENFIIPQLQRKSGSVLFSYYLTPKWTATAYFWREHEAGNRPMGFIFNSSPSASASSLSGNLRNLQTPGVGVELPEPIDYWNNRVIAMSEYGAERFGVQFGYTGSFFVDNIPSFFFDSPFATTNLGVQVIPNGTNGCATAPNCVIAAVPAVGQKVNYPDNQAHYLNFAAAFDFGKHTHVIGSVNPGWLRQNEPFVPYTANTGITGLAPLPAASLNGDVQTLAMNWTAVSKLTKWLELEAKYRQYDRNNNTAVFNLTPIEGDTIGGNSTNTGQAAPALNDTGGRSNISFNRKDLDFVGNVYFLKYSSAKIGWEGEWFDRSHRDVAHTFENSAFGSIDYKPRRDLLFRVAGRHQDRQPDEYQDETVADPVTLAEVGCTSPDVLFTATQRCARRFDETARILDRGEVAVQWDFKNFTFAGTFTTVQNDYNQQGGVNSPVPLNFIPGTTSPYFLYGMLKDHSWIWSFDVTHGFNANVSWFAEFTRENYSTRMISRSRTPTSGAQTILTCTGCDTANNDWESTTADKFDTYAGGFDFLIGKRMWFSPYYSLAAGHGNVLSRALGNPGITSGADKFTLTGTSTADNYPETVVRIHELVAVWKFRVTKNFMPKVEYRYQQFDNKDYQTTPMTPYMGCIGVGAINPAGCPFAGPAPATLFNKIPSPFYPGFVVGDTAAARYLFLGVDQPSMRAHVLTITAEWHF